jgi:hypothetical protein
MRSLINRSFATVCGLAVLALSTASFAGSPPPPPWNPTKKLRIYFVLNDELRAANLLCAKQKVQHCPTGTQLAQRKIDYLNGVFEANRVNLRAEAAGVWEYPGNLRHHDGIREYNHDYVLTKRRKAAGADMILVVNHTALGSVHGGAATTEGWYAMQGNHNQHFAHEVGHMLGAGHGPGDWARKPYAVGFNAVMVSDLMGSAWYGKVDHYSDHETKMGNINQSVGRYLRETYGRYSRYTGHGEPPPQNRPPRSSIIGR